MKREIIIKEISECLSEIIKKYEINFKGHSFEITKYPSINKMMVVLNIEFKDNIDVWKDGEK